MAASLQPSITAKDSVSLRGSSPEFDLNRTDSNRTLEEITRSALHATGASGAALVLSDGKVMSCRACSGELAPPVGTRLNPDAGFTATCVQTGEIVHCDDTATDPRIDGSSCIQLGIGSILAVPVFDGPRVAGVLEVLSAETKKFAERHVTALKLLARLVETLASYAPRNGSPDSRIANPTPAVTNSNRASTGEAKVMCLSCGHRNPQGSQFCNRCGVILLVSLTQPENAPDGRSLEADASAHEGLDEIYKLISENASRATWNDIYTRLMGNLQSTSAQLKPPATGKEEPAKRKEDGVVGLRTTREATELKTRLGAAVRRSLWL
jgi:hypothetical protein